MALLDRLFVWANAPYVVALGISLLFGTLQMSGLLAFGGDGAAGGDDAGGADGGAEAEAAAGDAGADAHDHGAGQALVHASGASGAPTSWLLHVFALTFGVTGLFATALVTRAGERADAATLLWSVPLAFVVALVATRATNRRLGPVLSGDASRATSRRELVGSLGVVISSKVDASFGEVRLRDRHGHTLRLVVATRDRVLREGESVVVVDLDDESGRLYVSPLDELEPGAFDAPKGAEPDEPLASAADGVSRATGKSA
jgi:hypothetical protein